MDTERVARIVNVAAQLGFLVPHRGVFNQHLRRLELGDITDTMIEGRPLLGLYTSIQCWFNVPVYTWRPVDTVVARYRALARGAPAAPNAHWHRTKTRLRHHGKHNSTWSDDEVYVDPRTTNAPISLSPEEEADVAASILDNPFYTSHFGIFVANVQADANDWASALHEAAQWAVEVYDDTPFRRGKDAFPVNVTFVTEQVTTFHSALVDLVRATRLGAYIKDWLPASRRYQHHTAGSHRSVSYGALLLDLVGAAQAAVRHRDARAVAASVDPRALHKAEKFLADTHRTVGGAQPLVYKLAPDQYAVGDMRYVMEIVEDIVRYIKHHPDAEPLPFYVMLGDPYSETAYRTMQELHDFLDTFFVFNGAAMRASPHLANVDNVIAAFRSRRLFLIEYLKLDSDAKTPDLSAYRALAFAATGIADWTHFWYRYSRDLNNAGSVFPIALTLRLSEEAAHTFKTEDVLQATVLHELAHFLDPQWSLSMHVKTDIMGKSDEDVGHGLTFCKAVHALHQLGVQSRLLTPDFAVETDDLAYGHHPVLYRRTVYEPVEPQMRYSAPLIHRQLERHLMLPTHYLATRPQTFMALYKTGILHEALHASQ